MNRLLKLAVMAVTLGLMSLSAQAQPFGDRGPGFHRPPPHRYYHRPRYRRPPPPPLRHREDRR